LAPASIRQQSAAAWVRDRRKGATFEEIALQHPGSRLIRLAGCAPANVARWIAEQKPQENPRFKVSPILIIRVSQRLAKRLKIRMSRGSYVQGVPLLSWNADELTLPDGSRCAFLSEDATLYSILVPLRGIRTESELISRVIERLQGLAKECGQLDLFKSVNVIFTKRTDRRRIGSQNDLMSLCWYAMDDAGIPFLPAMVPMLEECANQAPLSVLERSSPNKEMKLLKKAGGMP
jgi:hypothetical protein